MNDDTPNTTTENAPEAQAAFVQSLPPAGSLPLALGTGLVAALIGAVIWAAITVAIEYQIGWMAVGVGCLVGFTVRWFGKGTTSLYGYIGGGLALLGCVLGNAFSILGFVCKQADIGLFRVLEIVDLSVLPGAMAQSFSPMDLLFYGIAIYEGYKFSVVARNA